jgi:RNA polymerase sigma-70 factor (ECF subfamily)
MEQLYDSDKKALLALAQGHERAFRHIYDSYYYSVARVGMKYLQDIKLTEDLVQEIFSAIWAHRTQFTEVEQFQFYLYAMVKNRALKYLKSIARESAARVEFNRSKPDGDNNIDRYLNDKEYAALIEHAVENLPEQRKKIFRLARYEGLSHYDIAQRLQLSPQTVSNQMATALKTIRAAVQEHLV